jgi:phosphoserine aminotransferase
MGQVSAITIPVELRPLDGRFGAGPSKVRAQQIDHFVASQALLGTSHRQAPIKDLVGRVRAGLTELFRLPDGYEVVLGNGGSTALWDALAFSLIRQRSAHLSFGEFGQKFVTSATTPWLEAPHVVATDPGTRGTLTAVAGVDVYAWPHNETSTGVSTSIARVAGADEGSLFVVDATSAAGGIDFDASETDVYYFAPQKNFASDGGLWCALMSPEAIARVAEIDSSERYIPPFLSLQQAIDNSRLNQTLNTPALGTLLLMEAQLQWMLELGGLSACAERTSANSSHLYNWAEAHPLLTPFVANPAERSPVIVTIDVDDSVDATKLTSVLRANGIVDTEPYRKLGRNQVRIATFVGVELDDIARLSASIDYVLERLAD